jgi:hypothetical protein
MSDVQMLAVVGLGVALIFIGSMVFWAWVDSSGKNGTDRTNVTDVVNEWRRS